MSQFLHLDFPQEIPVLFLYFVTFLRGNCNVSYEHSFPESLPLQVENRYYWLIIYLNIPSRLFSCGTSKEGESHLVEWNESEGAIKRTYSGFRKRSLGVVQFDTTRNHFLAAGDEFQIKFWDMDNTNMLTYTDGDGGLPVSIYDSPVQL